MDQGRAFGARPRLRAAPGRRPRRSPEAGRFPTHAIQPAWADVLASDRGVAPSPWPLDRTATTTRIKSAYGVPTGSASRLLTRAALTLVGSYQGDGAGVASSRVMTVGHRPETLHGSTQQARRGARGSGRTVARKERHVERRTRGLRSRPHICSDRPGTSLRARRALRAP